MIGEEVRYKLAMRFEVRKVLVRDGGTYEQYTDERLNIEDNFDLGSAITLTAALAIIDKVGAIVRAESGVTS